MHLNSMQKKAVRFIKGPCLILAGAGSGKTRVIVEKIIYLISKCLCNEKKIVAITFTNKAAKEMKDRVLKKINFQIKKKLMVSTFHALGMKIIRSECNALKLKPNFSLFNKEDQIKLLKEITFTKFNNNKDLINKLILLISTWKNKLITPKIAKNFAKSELDHLFIYFYGQYNNYLRKTNTLDLDDLIFLPTLLLKDNLLIREKWQHKIQYLLVDEYQDTNLSQYYLIRLLVSIKNCNFTLVGDDNQSIYSWRGAMPKNLTLLKNDFPKLKVILMEHNYRSSRRILKVSNVLISHNRHEFKKNIFSTLEYGPKIEILMANSEKDEAEKVIKKILTHKLYNNTNYENYVILYRNNFQSKIFERVCLENNIPYFINKNNSFFLSQEIKYIIAYLRLIANPDDNIAFSYIVNIPTRKIGSVTLDKLKRWANIKNTSLFNSVFDLNDSSMINKKTINNLLIFVNWINKISNLFVTSPLKALNCMIIELKYKEWLHKIIKDKEKFNQCIENIQIFVHWINEILERDNFEKHVTLSKIVVNLLLNEASISDTDNINLNKIQLMTLHACKGLEFPFVFIIGMEDGILPHKNSILKNNIEEERRLTYVGITRAKKELFFSFSKTRMYYGNILLTKPSRFLLELPQNDLCGNTQLVFNRVKSNNLNNNVNRIKDLKKLINKYKI